MNVGVFLHVTLLMESFTAIGTRVRSGPFGLQKKKMFLAIKICWLVKSLENKINFLQFIHTVYLFFVPL